MRIGCKIDYLKLVELSVKDKLLNKNSFCVTD